MLRQLLAATVLTATAVPLHAQGWIDVRRPPDHSLPVSAISRVGSHVTVDIEGRVARVTVEEQFRNDGAGLAEGNYLYPLPGEAVFQNFSLWMGEQEVRGEVMSADQARAIYEEIVRRRRDPALLTLAGRGLVRAQVFPIAAGETRKVVLRYTQLLDRSGDALRFRYAVGDRGASKDPLSLRLSVTNAALYGTPFSPTHALTTRRIGDRLRISVDPGAAGDVELFLPLQQGLVGTTVVAHAPGGEDGYFMLLLSPPPAASGSAVPRDVTLVVDVSGSMSGDKLDQAKAALTQALGTLAPRDRFRLIAFSSAVRRFSQELLPATAANIAAARGFVGALSADGGTNIEGALSAALDTPAAEGRLPIIVFMTDGLPSVGEQSPERLAERAAARIGNARIFTVGVGHDVNTFLLDRLASEGHGAAEYVAPEASVEQAMGTLLAKLRFPALVNLRVAQAPVELVDLSPARLPDLFYGEELVVLGRYHGNGTGPLVIEGERNGRRERFSAAAEFPASAPANDFVARLWASRRVGDLTRQIRLEGATQDLVRQVRELALRHGILTEYTSYLVQEPDAVAGAGGIRRDLAPAAPAAQSGRAAFEAAQKSAAMSGATNLAAADHAANGPDLQSGAPDAQARRAGGRLFVRRGDVWTDVAHGDSLHVTAVAPFSPAYFELVRRLPELAPCFGVGDRVIIAGRRGSVEVSPAGAAAWRPGELERVVSTFRGT